MKEVPQGESIYSVLSILDILTVKCENNFSTHSVRSSKKTNDKHS